MRYEIIDGKVIEKPSNKKKEKDAWSYFDYHNPQLSSIKDPFKVIIKKLDKTNNKFDFITRHFIPYPKQLTRHFIPDPKQLPGVVCMISCFSHYFILLMMTT